MKLISNGFEYKVTSDKATLYYCEEPHSIAKRVTKEKYSAILDSVLIDGKINFEKDGEHFFFAFTPLEGLYKRLTVSIDTNKVRKEYVKWKLYKSLKEQFIIDFTRYGSDLTIYQKNQSSNWQGWDSYSSYNLIIRNWEIHLSIGSRNTLISKNPIEGFIFSGHPAYKALANGHILHKDTLAENELYQILASQEIRIHEK